MNVLEKILEEILQYRKDHNLYAGRQVMEIERIIRSHMKDLPDTNVGKWIPVTEWLPEDDNYILLSFENFSVPAVGRYEKDDEGGAFFFGDEEVTCTSYGLYVNAWMPLPEAYRPSGE